MQNPNLPDDGNPDVQKPKQGWLGWSISFFCFLNYYSLWLFLSLWSKEKCGPINAPFKNTARSPLFHSLAHQIPYTGSLWSAGLQFDVDCRFDSFFFKDVPPKLCGLQLSRFALARLRCARITEHIMCTKYRAELVICYLHTPLHHITCTCVSK